MVFLFVSFFGKKMKRRHGRLVASWLAGSTQGAIVSQGHFARNIKTDLFRPFRAENASKQATFAPRIAQNHSFNALSRSFLPAKAFASLALALFVALRLKPCFFVPFCCLFATLLAVFRINA